jgi:hypothetical protein
MPVEMAIWRMTDAGPVPITYTPLGLERRLEDMIGADPSSSALNYWLSVARSGRTSAELSMSSLLIATPMCTSWN